MESISQPRGSEKRDAAEHHEHVSEETTQASASTTAVKASGAVEERSADEPHGVEADAVQAHRVEYRVYKRRWFGLIQLILLNIVVSWVWLTFAAISDTSGEYFEVSQTAINWLSTGFLFTFVIATPVTIWALHLGPKPSIVTASVLVLVGNWVRFGGTHATGKARYGVVLFGQIIVGLGQPFVLAAPTRYSDMWFSDRGRITATAVASLANPFGGALGQLISPMWATKASEVPNSVLYIAIIATVVCIPSFFLPAAPPTPPSASSSIPKVSVKESISILARNANFWLVSVTFCVYVGLFNAISSLLNQIFEPYGRSETQAGIAGALLIIVGLVTAAVISPIVDRTHHLLTPIKILVPMVGILYLAFYWAPPTTIIAGYVICALLGATSFALLPIALEYMVEVGWPASPEVGSVLSWAGGQLLGGIFIIVMGALKGAKGEPDGSMKRALIFQAVIACAVVPIPLCLGVKALGLASGNVKGRLVVDQSGEAEGVQVARESHVEASGV